MKMTKTLLLSLALPILACEGEQGPPGTNGTNGTNGTPGTNGVDGTDGMDGMNGMDGVDGVDGVDAARYDFRTDMPAAYTRVDRMGMPAVATALVSAAMKEAYNDADPNDDIVTVGGLPFWAVEYLTNLNGLHAALEDDLAGAGLNRCSTGTGATTDSTNCALQDLIPGSGFPVVGLIVPDTIVVDPTGASGFPNGRRLEDPVIDITLAVLLLDLSVAGGHTPADLVGVLNPAANDVDTLTAFPYLGYPF
jgi:hypothetical protein